MESFNFHIEQNLNEILADFHKKGNLSWHSSNIQESSTKQNTMLNAESMMIGSKIKATSSTENFDYKGLNFYSEQLAFNEENEKKILLDNSFLVQNDFFNLNIKNQMNVSFDKNELTHLKKINYLNGYKKNETIDDQCAFDPFNRNLINTNNEINCSNYENFAQKKFNIELEKRLTQKLNNASLSKKIMTSNTSNISGGIALKVENENQLFYNNNKENLNILQPTFNRTRILNGATIINGVNLANLKFVKPASQCIYWKDHQHRINQPNCQLWHPRELCKYYPKCTLTAEVCGFGHPFCGEICQCKPKKRSLQKNHRIISLNLLPNKITNDSLSSNKLKNSTSSFTNYRI